MMTLEGIHRILVNPLGTASLQIHVAQPNIVQSYRTSFLNSSGEPKFSKDTKYFRLNVGEMCLKWCKKHLKCCLFFSYFQSPQIGPACLKKVPTLFIWWGCKLNPRSLIYIFRILYKIIRYSICICVKPCNLTGKHSVLIYMWKKIRL